MRVGRVVMLVIAAAGIGLGAPAPALHAQDSRPAQVTGTVIDITSKEPIAGARVGILPNIWPYRELTSATTDEAGRFTLSNLGRGFHELYAQHEDYVRRPSADGFLPAARFIELAPGESLSGVTLGLGRASSLSGTVRDEAGEPVVKAEVMALRRDPRIPGGFQSTGLARTDDRGAYRITPWQTGEFLIFVRPNEEVLPRMQTRASLALSYPGAFHPAALRPSGAAVIRVGYGEDRRGFDVSLARARGVTVSGSVSDAVEKGRLLDLFLVPMDGDDPVWELTLGSTRIPPGGRFSFSNVPPGRYLLSGVSFPPFNLRGGAIMQPSPFSSVSQGFRRVEPVVEPPTGDTLWAQVPVVVDRDDVDLAVSLARGSRIRGRVVFDGTTPSPSEADLAQVEVTVRPVNARPLGSMPIGGLRADGTFTTIALPPGEYRVSAVLARFGTDVWRTRSVTAGGKDVTGQPISIGPSDIDDFVQTLTDRRTVMTGMVTDRSGQPVPYGRVAVFLTDRVKWGPGAVMYASASQRGTFEAEVWQGAGEYFVAAIPAALSDRLMDADVLQALSRTATTVRIGEGQQATVRVTAPAAAQP